VYFFVVIVNNNVVQSLGLGVVTAQSELTTVGV